MWKASGEHYNTGPGNNTVRRSSGTCKGLHPIPQSQKISHTWQGRYLVNRILNARSSLTLPDGTGVARVLCELWSGCHGHLERTSGRWEKAASPALPRRDGRWHPDAAPPPGRRAAGNPARGRVLAAPALAAPPPSPGRSPLRCCSRLSLEHRSTRAITVRHFAFI